MADPEPDRKSDDRAAKITAVVFSVIILAIMFGVHMFMKYGNVNSIAVKHERGAPAASALPKLDTRCTLSSRPAGAMAHELRADGPAAIGVTPLDVAQGDYTIRLELAGYEPLELTVGQHPEPCTVDATLLRAE